MIRIISGGLGEFVGPDVDDGIAIVVVDAGHDALLTLGVAPLRRDVTSRVPRYARYGRSVTPARSSLNFTVRKILTNHPNLTASSWAQGLPYRHQKDLDALITPLRLAGLPE